MGGKVEGFSGTTIKDTWTKPRGVESGEGGEGGWWGRGMVGGKCRQLYLNNNKIIKKINVCSKNKNCLEQSSSVCDPLVFTFTLE